MEKVEYAGEGEGDVSQAEAGDTIRESTGDKGV